MKKKYVWLLLTAIIVSLSGCGKEVEWNGKTEVMADLLLAEDISDMRWTVGFADYVFAGTVEEAIKEVLPRSIKNYEDNFSTYKIHVDQNLKGELIDEVIVSKMGGLTKDGTMSLVVAELPNGERIADTELPMVNK